VAEFCLTCYNKLFDKNLTEKDVKLSPDICEGCGEIKDTIVTIKNRPRKYSGPIYK
jgi:hypothetical protein